MPKLPQQKPDVVWQVVDLGEETKKIMPTGDYLDPGTESTVALVDLSVTYKFYHPTQDGLLHFNRAIRRFEPGKLLAWGCFLATMLNEAVAENSRDGFAGLGHFLYTPNATKYRFEGQGDGGPDLVFCYERWTPEMVATWRRAPPWLRCRMSQITQAVEDAQLPVLPIYLIGSEHFGGDFPTARALTANVDKDTSGLVLDVLDATYHVCTVQEFLSTVGQKHVTNTRPKYKQLRFGSDINRREQGAGHGTYWANEQWWRRFRVTGRDPHLALIEKIASLFQEDNVISFQEAWSWTLGMQLSVKGPKTR
ncbi:hypothetical protein LTR85_010061 [Meristemomyces frigidus]|nr:hypothetical protein LTR85_010061 [Meristemomyces frigidus]